MKLCTLEKEDSDSYSSIEEVNEMMKDNLLDLVTYQNHIDN